MPYAARQQFDFLNAARVLKRLPVSVLMQRRTTKPRNQVSECFIQEKLPPESAQRSRG